jgi:hypothetical protein
VPGGLSRRWIGVMLVPDQPLPALLAQTNGQASG